MQPDRHAKSLQNYLPSADWRASITDEPHSGCNIAPLRSRPPAQLGWILIRHGVSSNRFEYHYTYRTPFDLELTRPPPILEVEPLTTSYIVNLGYSQIALLKGLHSALERARESLENMQEIYKKTSTTVCERDNLHCERGTWCT